ncbi:MAG: UDP-4-amino-4,6-dideoxy-N-acetyl-beta-L-altrosamine transaminase [Vulcanimicrobiaceae bacterium]
MIPYARQSIDDADLAAVVEVLRSEYLTQGPTVPRFERAVAQRCGARFAVAACNATAALHLACLALGVGPGDRVWTSPNSFVASANCALYCGAEIDFVDIDPRTYALSTQALRAKLDRAERAGEIPKVVIAVDFAGQPCDAAGIAALRDRYGFRIIEDAAHAIGALYRGEPVGNGRYADVTVFSFHPVKIITTAEGGMALSNDAELAGRMALLRSHGVTRDAARMEERSHDPWEYEQVELGFNYRMTEVEAALGLAQLARIETFLERRRALAARYDRDLAGVPLVLPYQIPDARSAYHLYPIRVGPAARIDRRGLYGALRERGIVTNVHYIPIHTQPYYRALGFAPGAFPVAEAYYREALSLPLYYGLTDEQQSEVVAAVADALG